MLSRRGFLKLAGGGVLAAIFSASYAVALEPMFTPRIATYRLNPAGWQNGPKLKIVILSDFHACEPWMTRRRIATICDQANRLGGDVILLLGDYMNSMRIVTADVPPHEWALELAQLEAPLGVHAVQGNHDFWQDRQFQINGGGETIAYRALKDAGIPVYENDVVRLVKDEKPFWLAGISSQFALLRGPHRARGEGIDDLGGTLAKVTDDAPIILMAHEPDIFVRVPDRVSLTVSGHTHGGQICIFGYAPIVPSRFGNRFAYGHVREKGRDLIVSGGLGCSVLPIRFGSPPEITVIEIS